MSAWGPKPFEKDEALDWLTDLLSDGFDAIEAALEEASVPYLDADAGQRALPRPQFGASVLPQHVNP